MTRPSDLRSDPAAVDAVASRDVDTPIGRLTVTVSAAGLRSVSWPTSEAAHDPDDGGSTEPTAHDAAARSRVELLDRTQRQLEEYFDGERTDFALPLDPEGTEFQRAAWRALRAIPYGTTVSYAEQAAAMGQPGKARAVGAANGRNPIPIIVPCHRVVGSDGSLTGFAGGLDSKRDLLDLERRVSGQTLL